MDSFISALKEAKMNGLSTDMLGDNRAQYEEDVAWITQCRQDISNVIASSSSSTTTTANQPNTLQFVIVDGFLMFSDDRALSLFDLPLFLKADRQVLVERRNRRNGYITIEGFWQEPEGYFDRFVWPNYM